MSSKSILNKLNSYKRVNNTTTDNFDEITLNDLTITETSVSNGTDTINTITENTATTYRMNDIFNKSPVFFADFETSLLLENIAPSTMTNSGGVTLSGGKAVGTGSDYLLAPSVDFSSITSSTGYTVCVDFSNFTNDTTGEQCIFAMGDNDILPRLDIYLDNLGSILFRHVNSGASVVFSASSSATGYTSAHLLFVVESGVGNRIYINGVKITPIYLTGSSSSEPLPTALNTLSLFNQVRSNGTPNAGAYSNCHIDTCYVLAQSITDNEATQLYNYKDTTTNYTALSPHNELVYTSKVRFNDEVRIADGSQALYSTLQSDSYGIASWVGTKAIIRNRTATNQTIPNSTFTTFTTTTTIYDSGHITQASDVYTITEAGVYLCNFFAVFANNGTGLRAIRFLNTATTAAYGRSDYQNNGAGSGVRMNISVVVYFNGVGTLTLSPQVFQSSGGNLDLAPTSLEPHFVSIVKLL